MPAQPPADSPFQALAGAPVRLLIIGGNALIAYGSRAPKPLHLVALKLHALKQNPDRMGKDWDDIRYLLDTKRDEWTVDELSTLAARYASDEVQALLRNGGYL